MPRTPAALVLLLLLALTTAPPEAAAAGTAAARGRQALLQASLCLACPPLPSPAC